MTPTDTHLTPDGVGIDYAVHAPNLDRFPWQLALADGRVVLLSGDLARSAVLNGGGDVREPNDPHEVPLPLVPAAVLAATRLALSRADEDELNAVLHRRRQIAQVWGVDDVIAVRPDLTDDQAWDVLREVERTMDADTGITWRVLEDTAGGMFGPAALAAGG
jgi:hypothetical protein